MKASEAHLPINMMVYVGIFARFIIIVAPDLFEWVPTSAAVKPRMCFPMAVTVALMSCKISVLVIWENFLPS